MMLFFDFSQKHPFLQLLILCFIMVAGALFSILFAQVLGITIYGKEVVYSSIISFENLTTEQIAFQKLMQCCNQIGTLLLPAIVFAGCCGQNIRSYFKTKTCGGWVAFAISLITIFSITPFIAMLQEWNSSIVFPEWMHSLEQWMKIMENNANSLTQTFLETHSMGILLLNIGLMAVLPAIAEECFFRGVVQNIFQQWTKNSVWAIIITAIIFSSFHFQFYGFFPRMILGIVLGSLYVISGSLWVPIFAHFVNNAFAVVISYLEFNNLITFSAEEFGKTDQPFWIIISVFIVLGSLLLLKKQLYKTKK
ncbi:MAG: CPBP family intramembrane metalloprotease [Bacteroidales bacterium]|nr:CPBP family intramembrane metalloprotease [Bacteroidales bacterium]